MNGTERNKDDTRLLIGVAAAVLLVAAAVVFTASQLREVEETQVADRTQLERSPQRSMPSPPATPASLPMTTVEPPAGPTPEAGSEPVEAEPPSVAIDPDADFVAEGERAYAAREFALAAAYFEAEAARRPHDSWARYMLGLSLWKCGEPGNAERAMHSATELNPVGIKGWINLSRIRNDLGRYEEALSAARAALALESDQPQALFLEGRSLANLGLIDDALESLDASLAQDADNGFVQNLAGLVRLQRGDAPAAVAYLQRAADLVPSVGFVHNNLGMALERSGRLEEAVIAYRRGVDSAPEHDRLAVNLARLAPLVAEEAAVAVAAVDTPDAEDETLEVAGVVEVVESGPSVRSVASVDGGTER